jgi:hypothetical protein
MKLIESKTVTTGVSAVEFTSIPQDGTDLVVKVSNVYTTAYGNLSIQFNNVTTNYSGRFLQGRPAGPNVVADTNPLAASLQIHANANDTSGIIPGSIDVYIPNYTASQNKSVSADSVVERNNAETYLTITAGLWSNTAAITSLKILTSTTMTANTVLSLYKITKGSDGIVTTSP